MWGRLATCAAVDYRRQPIMKAAVVTRLRDSEKYSFLELTITEGRNRQVRRMLEAVESRVLKLVRTASGPVRIGDLPIGKWRHLIPEEVHALRGRASSKVIADRRHARQKERAVKHNSNS